jgi:tetratricopeptide (TPR) repeat protein
MAANETVPPSPPPATPSSAAPESDGARLRRLLQARQYGELLATADALIAADATHREAMLFRAIALRLLDRVPDALATLAALEHQHPKFSRVFEERGQCHVVLRQAPDAIAAFDQAVRLNYALPTSWSMLERLYRMAGRADDAAAAAGQAATLRRLPREVVTATGFFLDGDLDSAERRIRAYLLEHGNEVEAMRLLARIGMARKVYDDAEILLEAVLELAPDYRTARAEYAEVLIERYRYADALPQIEQLLADDPANQHYLHSLEANARVGLGEHERAMAIYRELLAAEPRDADLQLSLAHVLKTLGRTPEAIESYRRAAASRPGFGDAYWSLANLKTYRFTDAELVELRTLEDSASLSPTDRCHVDFALGKALEDRGDYAESIRYYERGNAEKRRLSHYAPEIIEINTRRQIEVCTKEFFAARAGVGAADPDPIFIVGLPRSGSTLIEQILASHSQVEGTQELANIQHIVHELRGREPDLANPRYPQALAELSPAEFRSLGERYLATTRVYRHGKPGPVPYFIDKMPNNFRHLGLIRLILPNAKVIDARREPLACCIGNLKQLFAKGQEFTYGVEDIARYYRTYLELMRHWNDVLPGWVLRVQHEDVVDDLEVSVRRILEFCGLPFEPACLEFHKTVRTVRTASSEQVRRPINREGIDQWRNFEPWLGPLKDALGDALTRYRE